MYNKNKLSAFILVLGVIFLLSASKPVLSGTMQTSGKSFTKTGQLTQGSFFKLTDGRKPKIKNWGNGTKNFGERFGRNKERDRGGERYERRDRDRDRDGDRYERRDRDRDDYGSNHQRGHHRRDRD